MTKISLLILGFLMATTAFTQDLESELGFLYVKAEYLLETNRYEEAITELNKIIQQDASYEEALLLRANAKFTIGAFAGAKNDLIRSFELHGVTHEAILLLGQTQKNMGNDEAANVTLTTASRLLEEENARRSSPTKKMPQKKEEPTNETEAASTDDKQAEDRNAQQEPQKEEDQPAAEEEEKNTGERIKEGLDGLDKKVSDIMEDILGKDEKAEETEDTGAAESQPKGEVYVPDMSVNEIYIDEDLTILIQDGLGGRKIQEQPNVLILSETSGEVAVDVCVNENGKVTSAVFNKDRSTLAIQSLISLAVRKSREFLFEASNRKEICGSIIFRITGRT